MWSLCALLLAVAVGRRLAEVRPRVDTRRIDVVVLGKVTHGGIGGFLSSC